MERGPLCPPPAQSLQQPLLLPLGPPGRETISKSKSPGVFTKSRQGGPSSRPQAPLCCSRDLGSLRGETPTCKGLPPARSTEGASLQDKGDQAAAPLTARAPASRRGAGSSAKGQGGETGEWGQILGPDGGPQWGSQDSEDQDVGCRAQDGQQPQGATWTVLQPSPLPPSLRARSCLECLTLFSGDVPSSPAALAPWRGGSSLP